MCEVERERVSAYIIVASASTVLMPNLCCLSLSLFLYFYSFFPIEPRHRASPLPERAGHRGLWEAMRAHPVLHQYRQEGMGQMDERGAHWPAEAHV